MSADQQLALARATRGESSHLSKAAQKVVPPFLQKLYEIVNDPKNDELIRWSESGDSFYVLNHERFAREVLGRWFKHQKFTSFVRQLNMYGFHKIPHLQQGVLKSENDTEPWHFEHPHFHRGQPDLLCLIQRKKQPAHGGDEIGLDLNEGAHPTAPMANLTPGQVLDINSIMNGITAIKRHQQAISADLNELKSSNQHLWQEALAARERHKKHQDTINRILKFLAGVFGNSAEAVKHDGSHTPPPVMPRKRQRLMIESSGIPEKRKAAVVEEVEDDEDDRQSVRSDGGIHGNGPINPMKLYASIETPETIHSPRSPSIAPSDNGLGPTITDITSSFRPSAGPTIRPTDVLSHSSSDINQRLPTGNAPDAHAQIRPLTDGAPPSTVMSLTTGQPQQGANADWSATLHNLLASPVQLQRLMQALAAQQNQPMPTIAHTEPGHGGHGGNTALDPRLVTHQVTPYDHNTFDLSRFHSDIPPSAVSVPNSTLAPAMLGPLISRDDGPSLEPLMESANRLQKTYHDASEIDEDVNALQDSLNSLINTLGLEHGHQQPQEPVGSPMNVDAVTNEFHADPSSDFDFEAFLNELANRSQTDPAFMDVTSRFDPSTPLDGTTLGDASTDQLTAFLDDVSDTASLHEPLEHAPKLGAKRKSDVADLPLPLAPSGLADQSPKVKRKR